jgi:hypothetical protein
MTVDFTPKPNMQVLGVGIGIGVLWVAMAAWCLTYGLKGYSFQRTDYGLAWTTVGVLLLGAGVSAIVGTWWHQFVVKHRHHE